MNSPARRGGKYYMPGNVVGITWRTAWISPKWLLVKMSREESLRVYAQL